MNYLLHRSRGSRIVVNCRFLSQEVTGVQRYGMELARELRKMDASILFVTPGGVLHRDCQAELGAEPVGRLDGHFWEQVELPIFLASRGSPLLVNLANTAPLSYRNTVSVVHDIAFERYPLSFSRSFRGLYRFVIPKVLHNAREVVTVSDFSRRELAAFYGVDSERISIVHNAVSELFRPVATAPVDRYILAVSSLSRQKNFHSLIRAFNLLADKSVKLYVAGGFSKSFADAELLADIASNDRIVFKGRVDDSQLVELYANAACFVFPSLYEGFGIPPIEAQACGCPVVASRAASIPEVCGDSVVYFDPSDIGDIADKISLVLNDAELRQDLVRMGIDNCRRYSWRKSAERLYEIIGKVSSDI